MSDTNVVTVEGNLTRDPDLRYSQSGSAFCNFGVAWNQGKKDANVKGGWLNVAHFFDVSCFGHMAEHVAESLVKGQRVVVAGRLDYSTWVTKDSGEKRWKISILADSVSPSLRFCTATVEQPDVASRSGRNEPPGRGPVAAPDVVAFAVDEEPF